MITFDHITDVGRGRLFLELKSNGSREELFLTTTCEWVLRKNGTDIQHVSDTPNIEQFAFNTGNAEYMIECFSVLQGADLPSDFKTRHGDESTWVRLPNDCEIWSEGTLKKLASVAVAVCVHLQINDAYIYGFDEHPLALHALGPPDLYHW